MTERKLGQLRVSAIGLGCMGMSEFYDPSLMNDEESIRVIHRYLDAGGNFLDTADMYGVGRNEVLVGKAIRDRREQVVLATKFGNVRGPNGEFLGIRGDPQYVRDCCDASLKRLGVNRLVRLLEQPSIESENVTRYLGWLNLFPIPGQCKTIARNPKQDDLLPRPRLRRRPCRDAARASASAHPQAPRRSHSPRCAFH